MLVTLTVTAGPLKGQQFAFAEHDTFVVGRSRRAHLRFRDKSLSRFHFLVEINPPSCRVVDLRSQNGTFVNRERVDSADLKHGDKISAGDTRFRVAIVDAPEDEASAGLSPALVRPTALASPRLEQAPALTRPSGIPAVAPACPACGAAFPPTSAVWTQSAANYRPLVCADCLESIASLPQPIP